MMRHFCAFCKPHIPLIALDLSMAFIRALCAILIPLTTRHLFKLSHAPLGELLAEQGSHPELTALKGYYHTLYTKSLF